MSSTVRYALIFVCCAIATKLILFNTGIGDDSPQYSIFANLLYILLAVFLGLKEERKRSDGIRTEFIEDFKNGMKTILVFVVTLSIFTFIYYTYIDPSFFENRIEARVEFARTMDLEAFRAATDNEELRSMTREELVVQQRENAEFFLNAKTQTTFTLMLYMIVGIIYTITTVYLIRRNPFN